MCSKITLSIITLPSQTIICVQVQNSLVSCHARFQ